ncbi:MAG: hypothetical protein ACOH1K_03280, partial [Rhodoglobus sp.]
VPAVIIGVSLLSFARYPLRRHDIDQADAADADADADADSSTSTSTRTRTTIRTTNDQEI